VGANLDDFNGEITLVNSLFQKQDKQIQIYDFNLFAQHRPDTNRMILRSDFADAEITGQYEFEDIGKASARLLASHLPAFRNLMTQDQEDANKLNNFRFSFDFKNTFPITDFFFPELELARNSSLTGNYNPSRYELNFTGRFPEFRFHDNTFTGLELKLRSNDSIAQISTTSDIFESVSLISMEQLDFQGVAQNDSFSYRINWQNAGLEELSKGNLGGLATFEFQVDQSIPRIHLEMDPGSIVLKDTLWNINAATIDIDTTSIAIENARISHNNQLFYLDGKISQNPADKLEILFRDFDLSHLNQAFKTRRLEVDGMLEGSSTVSDIYGNLTFISDLSIEDFSLNGEELGNTFIKANWIHPEQMIQFDVQALRGELKTLMINGGYYPESRYIDFDLTLDKLRLNIIEPYLSGIISDLSGITSGNVRLTGTTNEPLFNGMIQIQKTSLKVDYLQTIYSFSNAVEIRNNNLIFKDFEIFDQTGSRSVLNGGIRNTNLRDFVFDLNLDADNFHFLGTQAIHNNDFYGDARATGLLRLSGSRGDLQLNISARTDKGTHILIPINKGRTIEENNFITFINTGETNPGANDSNEGRSGKLTGFTLEINIEATPDAITEIIFDPQVGDIMKGNGRGNIQLLIDPEGEFRMFGEYIIESGEYLFTLQNIFNKRLRVQQGGSITWNGDPTAAIIDMHAIYNAMAAPGVLVPEPADYLKNRMPVECHLIMTGNLLTPLISFDIQMPNAEAETRNILRNAISTEEELTKQFLSLLVMNNFSSVSFYSGSGSATVAGAGMAGVTASEMLSNQLSNWLSQISNEFDIGVNYRPGDEISNEQVEVALSTQIFDDRVTIHTNVDVTSETSASTASSKTNTIVGDFDVDVKITGNGKLRFKAYNRYNHDQLYKTSPYTQGIGFIFREDFNNLGELGRRYREAIIRNGNNKKEEKQVEE
jgi:hypothetical protein